MSSDLPTHHLSNHSDTRIIYGSQCGNSKNYFLKLLKLCSIVE